MPCTCLASSLQRDVRHNPAPVRNTARILPCAWPPGDHCRQTAALEHSACHSQSPEHIDLPLRSSPSIRSARSAVAMTATPVPATFSMRVSPVRTSRSTTRREISDMTEWTLARGTSPRVRTGSRRAAANDVRAVEHTVRIGFVSSFHANSIPRGQRLPVTSQGSKSWLTWRLHPLGHTMHVNSLTTSLPLPLLTRSQCQGMLHQPGSGSGRFPGAPSPADADADNDGEPPSPLSRRPGRALSRVLPWSGSRRQHVTLESPYRQTAAQRRAILHCQPSQVGVCPYGALQQTQQQPHRPAHQTP